MKIIRENADEWHILKDKIAVCGFSAGGHLTASLGTFWHLDSLKEDVTCTLQIIAEGLGRLNEPTQKEIREVNDIMNNSIDGWVVGKQKRLPGYGQQRTWRRKPEIEQIYFFESSFIRSGIVAENNNTL